MNKIYDKVKECYKQVNEMTEFKPQIALVLGSGLGDYAEKIKIETVIDYHEIKGFPVSTVQGHKGRFVLGYVEDIPVMIMEGRVHYYEGYSMSDVVLPIRLMKMMGAEILFLTNASGGIHRGFEAGDFMMITDQIASFVPSTNKFSNSISFRFSNSIINCENKSSTHSSNFLLLNLAIVL